MPLEIKGEQTDKRYRVSGGRYVGTLDDLDDFL